MRALAVLAAMFAAASAGDASDDRVAHTLVLPTTAIQPGSALVFQLATLNRSAETATFLAARATGAVLIAAGQRTPLTLKRGDAAGSVGQTAHPNGFALDTYSVSLPADLPPGLALIEVQFDEGKIVRGAIDVQGMASGEMERPVTHLVRAEPAVRALRRTFAERIAPHESTYFIYGADDPVAKFQFSFKYKLFDFRNLAPQRMVRSVHFAFTQRSLWDFEGASSPFYDTSYMPEILYQSLTPATEKRVGTFAWLGYQAAFKHESNGRDGAQTRSVNVVYARPVFSFGCPDDWHLLVVPEIFGYLGSRDDNPDIADYRGYGKLHLIFGRNDGPSVSAVVWGGRDFNHLSAQVDLTVPVRTQFLNFETYFLVQYFNGYGESLLSHRRYSEAVRAGISLVR